MGWRHDPEKVRRHVDEAKRFWDVARGDEPAGLKDLVGRPFQHPSPSEPDVTPQPHPTPEVNLYVLQAAQLYEAGAINQQQFNLIVNSLND